MYTVTYQYGTPDGKIRSSYRWTQAKDEADAKLKIAEILGKDTTIKWFKIGKTTKINH